MRFHFVRRWLLTFTVAGAFVGSAQAQPKDRNDNRPGNYGKKDDKKDTRYTGDAPKSPPPMRVAEPKPAPKKGETWIAGHHDWKGGKWEWVPGKWEPAKPGRRAEPPKWEKKGDVFVKIELKWVDVPVPAHKDEPAAKTPKPGQSWQGGHHEWNGNDWTWVPGKWVAEQKGKKWRPHTWNKKGDDWVETKGDWEEDKTVAASPTSAPPEPKVEKPPARPGQVFISGRWDWKGGKWEWAAGKWEKEQPGKRFKPGRWANQNNKWLWIDGEWIAEAGPTQAPPAPKAENPPARPGQVFIAGRWDWKGGKWEWQAGKWEKEQPGKRHKPGRWTETNKVWTWQEGEWVADTNDGPPRQAPPVKAEPKPAPKKGETWIAGHHDWKGGKWEWVPGKWEPAKPGRRAEPPKWEKKGDVFVKVELKWVDVPVPAKKEEPQAKTPKPGQSWQGGQHEWNGHEWTWVPGKWVPEVKGKKWRDASWTKKGDEWVEVKGDWEDDKSPKMEPKIDPKKVEPKKLEPAKKY